jgi:hypothetical protein
MVLRPHLVPYRVFASAIGLDNSLAKGGGTIAYNTLRRNIKGMVGSSREHQWVTTMIDLYALPRDYPGWERVAKETGVARAQRIEAGMTDALPNSRFLPFVMVHEFEALVLVDVDRIPSAFPDGEAACAPKRLRQLIGNLAPEDVDDGPATAPSKRIIEVLPAYRNMKAIAGPQITGAIGMAALRAACPHFGQWVALLEGLAS